MFWLRAQRRFDIGIFIATDGDPELTGAKTGQCARDILPRAAGTRLLESRWRSVRRPRPANGPLTRLTPRRSARADARTILQSSARRDAACGVGNTCMGWVSRSRAARTRTATAKSTSTTARPGTNTVSQLDCTSAVDVKAANRFEAAFAGLAGACIAFPDDNPCTLDFAGTCSNATLTTCCQTETAMVGPATISRSCTSPIPGAPCTGTSNGGACDGTDSCDGAGTASTASSRRPRSVAPRRVQCDVAESCTGSSGACPADGFQPRRRPARGPRTAAPATGRTPATAAGALRGRLPAGDHDLPCLGRSVRRRRELHGSRAPARRTASSRRPRPARGPRTAAPATGPTPATAPAHLRGRLPVSDHDLPCRRPVSATSPRAARVRRAPARRTASSRDDDLHGDLERRRLRRDGLLHGRGDHCVDGFQPATTICRARPVSATSPRAARDRRARARRTASSRRRRPARGPRTAAPATGRTPATARRTCVDGFQPATTICRPRRATATSPRAAPGSSGACPADGFQPATTTCTGTSTGGVCDVDRHLQRRSGHLPSTASSRRPRICRAVGRAVRRRRELHGRRRACPADGFAAGDDDLHAGPRAAASATWPRRCDGTARHCPSDGFEPATTICRASAGSVRRRRELHGTSGACPADGFAAGDDDLHRDLERRRLRRDGSLHGQRRHLRRTASSRATTICRASAGECDVAESCTGTSGACPADGFQPGDDRLHAGPRTAVSATGGDLHRHQRDSLPLPTASRRRPRSAVPRPGSCDVAESCTGRGAPVRRTASSRRRRPARRLERRRLRRRRRPAAAPPAACADGFQRGDHRSAAPRPGAATSRRAAPARGATCPADGFQPATTVCRASAGRLRRGGELHRRRARPVRADAFAAGDHGLPRRGRRLRRRGELHRQRRRPVRPTPSQPATHRLPRLGRRLRRRRELHGQRRRLSDRRLRSRQPHLPSLGQP